MPACTALNNRPGCKGGEGGVLLRAIILLRCQAGEACCATLHPPPPHRAFLPIPFRHLPHLPCAQPMSWRTRSPKQRWGCEGCARALLAVLLLRTALTQRDRAQGTSCPLVFSTQLPPARRCWFTRVWRPLLEFPQRTWSACAPRALRPSREPSTLTQAGRTRVSWSGKSDVAHMPPGGRPGTQDAKEMKGVQGGPHSLLLALCQ